MQRVAAILFVGDIVGRPGRSVHHKLLPGLARSKKIDFVIANAENIAGGSGITPNLFNKLSLTASIWLRWAITSSKKEKRPYPPSAHLRSRSPPTFPAQAARQRL